MQEEAKQAVDTLAVGGGVATYIGWLPDAAALMTIIWLAVRIWESETVQKVVNRDSGD